MPPHWAGPFNLAADKAITPTESLADSWAVPNDWLAGQTRQAGSHSIALTLQTRRQVRHP
jgi:hypothetical protein